MASVTVEDAQARLPVLIAELEPGQEVIIPQHDRPVARLIGEPPKPRKLRRPGSAIGKLIIIAEDDEHRKDFHEHMP